MKTKKRSGWVVVTRLIGLVKPLTGWMFLAVFMGLLGHLCAAWIPVCGAYALTALVENWSLSLRILFIAVGVFALLRGALRYAEQECNHYIAFKLLAAIRSRVFRALRTLCPAKLEGRGKGDLISLLTSDIELLEVFYAHTISPIAIAVLFSGVMVVLIGQYHILLGLVALLAYLTVGVAVPLVISKCSGDTGMAYRNQAGGLSSFVLDSIRGLSETVQYGQGEKRLEEMNRRTEALSGVESRMKKNVGLNAAITNGVVYFFNLVMLLTAYALYQRGLVSFAGVLLPTVALMSSYGPCIALAGLGSTLQSTFAAGNRVLDILEEKPVTEDITGEETISFAGAEAHIRRFSYGEETVLQDVDAVIPENTVVGIIGRSGSGKSTLLKLLMRFWKVEDGEVSVSGRSVEHINTTNLRDMESLVMQETYLFHDSIRNNLKLAKLDATDAEIREACRKASVDTFIESLPDGYDTPVGELGDTVSGGEKQRIGLARAFLHDAPFLLLDEPTSNLDSLNEAVILHSLHEQKKGKTIVLVSHRPSTACIADVVYSVESGRMS